jgi:predicted NAD/FAD-binding protein
VYIYEAADRLGGHTNTVPFKHGKFQTQVDTGFIVLNTATYRKDSSLECTLRVGCSCKTANFINLLEHLEVPTTPTEMTFSVSRDAGALEWAGKNLATIFAQKRSIASKRMWTMLFDIVRFNHYALDLIREDEIEIDVDETVGLNDLSKDQETIGQYLQREGYSEAFKDDYLIPMTAAVWSTSPDKCALDFPAMTLVRFLSVCPVVRYACSDDRCANCD